MMIKYANIKISLSPFIEFVALISEIFFFLESQNNVLTLSSAHSFIASIKAVIFTIANPTAIYATATITFKLKGKITDTVRQFVTVIKTVSNIITCKYFRHTQAICACKWAFGTRAIHFVASVKAIFLSITHPCCIDAATRGTGELRIWIAYTLTNPNKYKFHLVLMIMDIWRINNHSE